jgi:hypothetical protein
MAAKINLTPALAKQFLTALYGRFYSQAQGAAFLDVRGKMEGQDMSFRRFYPTPEALVKDMGGWPPGHNFWIGVALRKDSKGGAKANLLAMTAAFADVDAGAAGHKGATSYQTKDEARSAIEAFSLRPSLLVDSGGGFQPYWLFREPVGLTPERIQLLEKINRGLALALKGDPAATDAARILRLPGTFNMKISGNPRPVVMVWCEPERVYDLADFAPYVQAQAQGQAQKQGRRPDQERRGRAGSAPAGALGPGGEYGAYAEKALHEELTTLARTPEGSHNRNNRLNQAAFALGQLVGAGVLNRERVEEALIDAAAGIGLEETESRATIRSGLDAGINTPRPLPERAATGRKGARQGKPSASPEKVGQAAGDEEEAERKWLCGHAYFVERGRLCLEAFGRQGEPQPRTLANFTARIEEEITRDDGQKTTKEFQISGILDTGRPLPPARVTADKFDGLVWVRREWGAAATIAPGRSLGPHLVNAVLAFSQDSQRRTVFAHTGWRKIGGAWRYLHGGGAIGAGEPVEVDLGENLHLYRLPAAGGREAVLASLNFLEVAPWEVTAPMLACVYLAPFADLLKIDFSLWLYGPTGGKKSTLAALALSHFGEFSRKTLPGAWFSTGNSLEKLCFTLKDSLVVIDDFCPAASAKNFSMMAEQAGRLIYQAGNRSGRGRLAPDLSARPNYYPRGLILSTAEMLLPGQRQSATARYLGVELDPKKIPIDQDRLDAAQAEAGLYAAAMAAYLEALAPRLDEVQEEMRALFVTYRGAFQRGGGHARIPEIQAWLAVGFELAMRGFVRLGAITEDQKYDLEKRAWRVWEALGEKHSRTIEGERPTLKFLEILTELFLTSRVYCESKDKKGVAPPAKDSLGWTDLEPAKNSYLVGYADENTVYLLPNNTYKAVNEVIRVQGDYLALGKRELWAAMAREGIIEPGRGGRTTRNIRIQGGQVRVICLPLEKLTPEEEEENEAV